jgi:putative uncharacterized protein (fragment)
MSIRSFASPLRYPGGKTSIFPFMSSLFYENSLIGYSYAEPYAGGCGLALQLLFNEFVDKVYLNDYDKSIYSFWFTTLYHPNELCDWIEDVSVNLENWYECRSIYQNTSSDLISLAKATFFLNRTNVSGVLKGGVIGGQKQQGKYKIDARFNKQDLINRIQKIALFKERIHLFNLDGVDFVKKINRKKDDIFIYFDPPYYQKGSDLYMNYFKDKDHLRLKIIIEKLKKKWIVSYDNHEFIKNIYSNNYQVVYQLAQSTSNRVGDEVIIFSGQLRFQKAIQQLKNYKIIE